MLHDLRQNAFKIYVCCFLVCGHISYLQANAISKTSSCQGATYVDPLCMGLGQLICDILFLIGADCNNLFVWNFLKELLKYLLWGNVEISLGSFPRPSLLWLQNDQTWSQNIFIIAVNCCNLLIVEVFSCNVQGVVVCWNGQGAKKSHLRLESQNNLCRLFVRRMSLMRFYMARLSLEGNTLLSVFLLKLCVGISKLLNKRRFSKK